MSALAAPRFGSRQRSLMSRLLFCGPQTVRGRDLATARTLRGRGQVKLTLANLAYITDAGCADAHAAGLADGPTPRFSPNQARFMGQAQYYVFLWVSHDKLRTARQLERRGFVHIQEDNFGSFRAHIIEAGRIAAGRANIAPEGWNPYDPY